MLLLLLLALAALSAGARAQWRNGQRTHQLHLLPLNSTLRLCSFADQTRLRRYLQPLLVPRVVNTRSHRAAARHIKTSLDDLGFTTEWDNFTDTTPFGPKRFRNLIATWDTQAPRRLVLACHYDSKIFPGQTFIGATDSSVPCAMLLDIAHVLAPYMYKRASNQVGLQLLFFDGEEAFVEWSPTDSIYGSRHLAEKWEKLWYPTASGSNFELSRELDRIDVLMLLDLLGAPNPHLVNAAGNGATQLFAELPKIEQELRGLNCFPQIVPNIFSGALSFSAVEDDHIPFLRRGIPILHLISVPFPSVWHKVTDNESALHFPTIDYLTTVLRVFVAKYLGIAPL